jgi:hypothetical protein
MEQFVELLNTARRDALEEAVVAAKSNHSTGFGPSTSCPDCGSTGHVFHVWNIGKDDAVNAIRALIDKESK